MEIVLFQKPEDLLNLIGSRTGSKGIRVDPKIQDEAAKAARASVDPSTALALLDQGRREGSLTITNQVLVIEAVLGRIADASKARQLLENTTSTEAQVEMVSTLGDLPSVLGELVDISVIQEALENEDENYLLAWAERYKDRPDWEEILEMDVGDHSLRDLLIAQVAIEFGTPIGNSFNHEDFDDVDFYPEGNRWVDVGLDPAEANERLLELLRLGSLPSVDRQAMADAKATAARKRAALVGSATSADDLDL